MATLIDTEGYGDQFVLTEDSLTVKVSTTVDGTLDAGNTTIDGTLSAGNTTINGNLITTGNANIGGTATWAASIVSMSGSDNGSGSLVAVFLVLAFVGV